jgi:hypothetical protein
MLRSIFAVVIAGVLAVPAAVKADPSPTPGSTSVRPNRKDTKVATLASSKTATTVPSPSASGKWSLLNGVWTHSDGYKFVGGQVVRVGSQTHKRPPNPPTKAEMDAAMKKVAPKTPADAAAAKAAERERNLTPHPAPQTGSHL